MCWQVLVSAKAYSRRTPRPKPEGACHSCDLPPSCLRAASRQPMSLRRCEMRRQTFHFCPLFLVLLVWRCHSLAVVARCGSFQAAVASSVKVLAEVTSSTRESEERTGGRSLALWLLSQGDVFSDGGVSCFFGRQQCRAGCCLQRSRAHADSEYDDSSGETRSLGAFTEIESTCVRHTRL